MPSDPKILFQCVYPKELKMGTQIFVHSVQSSIFYTSQKVKNSKCLPGEWVSKM